MMENHPTVRLVGREPITVDPCLLPQIIPDTTAITLDLSDLEFVCPLDLVAVSSWSVHIPPDCHKEVQLPTYEAASYLERMNLLAHLRRRGWNVEVVGDGDRDALPHRLLEVTALNDPSEIEALADQMPRLFAAGASDPRRSRALHFAFGELCDNAISHSEGQPIYVAAQRYSGATSGDEARIELAVADGGIGIATHLRRNRRYRGIRTDAEALATALRPGVTGTDDTRGYGFFDILGAIQEVGRGEMSIHSGTGAARVPLGLGSEKRQFEDLPSPVAGTRAQIRLYEH